MNKTVHMFYNEDLHDSSPDVTEQKTQPRYY